MTLALRPESTSALERARAIARSIEDVIDVTFPADVAAEAQAIELARHLETVRRDVEKQREIEKRPHLDAGRAVDAAFRSATEPIDRLVALLRRRLSEAATKREEARRLAVAAASAAALAHDHVTANEAIALANDPVFAPVSVEGAAERVAWEVDAVDVEKAPRAYLAPDLVKLRAYARALPAGVEPSIEGVTFKRVVTHVLRSVKP